MKELLVRFDEPISGDTGAFVAQVWGEERSGGTWEGWIEFTPSGGGPALSTERETTQPNRTDLGYWATGLSRVYLEGALRRATDRARAAGAQPGRRSQGS